MRINDSGIFAVGLLISSAADAIPPPAVEKGVRHQKCKAPEGPFRLLVPDPFFQTQAQLGSIEPMLLSRCVVFQDGITASKVHLLLPIVYRTAQVDQVEICTFDQRAA